MDERKKGEYIDKQKETRLRAVRILGKYDKYVIRELLPDMKNHRKKGSKNGFSKS